MKGAARKSGPVVAAEWASRMAAKRGLKVAAKRELKVAAAVRRVEVATWRQEARKMVAAAVKPRQ